MRDYEKFVNGTFVGSVDMRKSGNVGLGSIALDQSDRLVNHVRSSDNMGQFYDGNSIDRNLYHQNAFVARMYSQADLEKAIPEILAGLGRAAAMVGKDVAKGVGKAATAVGNKVKDKVGGKDNQKPTPAIDALSGANRAIQQAATSKKYI